MTERHYAHLVSSHVAQVIRASMPKLGLVEPSPVVPPAPAPTTVPQLATRLARNGCSGTMMPLTGSPNATPPADIRVGARGCGALARDRPASQQPAIWLRRRLKQRPRDQTAATALADLMRRTSGATLAACTWLGPARASEPLHWRRFAQDTFQVRYRERRCMPSTERRRSPGRSNPRRMLCSFSAIH